MATAVASRFAVLSLDVEDDTGRARKADKKKAPSDTPVTKDKGSVKSGGSSQTKQQDAKKKANKKKSDANVR